VRVRISLLAPNHYIDLPSFLKRDIMTMHLVGPWLSTTGKKKTKQKFRNAESAARARVLQKNWQNLLDQHGVQSASKGNRKKTNFEPLKQAPLSYRGSDQPRISSLPFTAGVCARPADKVYTGDKIKGIGTMHKSNAVPVFSDEEARDLARMRRG
jgi:hypothetical protein